MKKLSRFAVPLLLAAVVPVSAVSAQNATVTTLYSFGVEENQPMAGLVQGPDGNFYGTSGFGGLGTVFRVTPAGAFTTLHQFDSTGTPTDGAGPEGTLALGSDGNFYGTTLLGGTDPSLAGTAFQITPAGVLTTLHNFSASDFITTRGGLVQGRDGNFYGTDSQGGANGQGSVYRLTLAGEVTTLYSFSGTGGSQAPLIVGGDGNFYGTTFGGQVFSITSAGAFTSLGSTGGDLVSSPVVQGRDGNFYGTNSGGGANGYGSVYQLTPAGVLTTLYSFTGQNNDSGTKSGLIQATDGNFYGTIASSFGGGGMVYRITAAGVLTDLHDFTGHGGDGLNSTAGVIQASDGNLYGTTADGGVNDTGTVFELTTHPSFFTGGASLGNGVYYLAFPTGSFFGYYSFLSDPNYIYHFDLGYEYVFDANDGEDGVYLYDFTSSDFFYTSPGFPFPYLFDFNLNTVLYYYPDPSNAGHYNTGGIRYFYDFGTGAIIIK